MVLLAHISDLHIPPLPPMGWRDLTLKRVLGYLSWHGKRRKSHRREVLDALRADIRAVQPDHILVGGDLTNCGLEAEFRQGAQWLESLGNADTISLVPGNHDAMTADAALDMHSHWARWMARDGQGDDMFPYVHDIGDNVAVIGVTTALPTPPFMATGTIGAGQMEKLEETLASLGRAGRTRLILMHHPPLERSVIWRKRLTDHTAFQEVIRRTGAEAILHGHAHHPIRDYMEGDNGKVPVIGVGAASKRAGAHYHLLATGAGRIDLEHRRYDPKSGCFVGKGDEKIDLARPA